jgi:hypothetical protein
MTRTFALSFALGIAACAGPRTLGWNEGEVTRLEISDRSHVRNGSMEGASPSLSR